MTMRDDSPRDDTYVEALVRELTSADTELSEPPASLWSEIEREVGSAPDRPAVVVDARHRFSLRARTILAAAAAVIVLAGGAAFLGRGDGTAPAVVASAELSYDPAAFDALGADAAAKVSLVDHDGALEIEVDSAALPTPTDESADLELWLIEPDSAGDPAALVSLGLIDPTDRRRFEIPEGYDPDVFFVVDISVEPRDGNAGHSGRSILRGALVRA